MRLLHKFHCFPRTSLRLRALACLFVLFLTLSPVRSFAQCEVPGTAEVAMGIIIDNDAHVILEEMVNNLQTFAEFNIDTMRMLLGLQDKQDWMSVMTAMNTWYSEQVLPWKAMTAQLSAATVDETFKLGAINNANNALAAAQDQQKERIKAKLRFQPNEQACRFDTNAKYLAQDRAIGEAVQNGFEWDFVSVANNEKGSLGEYGPGGLLNNRWNIYKENFCAYDAEDCDSGCSPPGGGPNNCPRPSQTPRYPSRDIYVSSMLFKDQTLAVEDKVAWEAVRSMMFNVTGYKVPDMIMSWRNTPSMEQVLSRRQYMAQMSAVGSMLYSVVGDRMEGVQATEPADLRKMMGITYAFNKPSQREIRQSIIEQLWDPNFYKNLGDNPASIAEKELYLKAYGLTMLYDMISKQEKISTAYAIETAAILEQTMHVRGNFSAQSPVGQ